jgi:alpha-glucosidase
MMVAEAWVHAERLGLYLRPDEYHQSFDFDLLEARWSAAEFAAIIERALSAAARVGASCTWVLSNHDVVRHATRYGLSDATQWRRWISDPIPEVPDALRGERRARAGALITLSLPGSAYVYQGDELALPEVVDLADEVRDDPVWRQTAGRERGRDGCRVPLPWEPDGPSFGFGSAAAWLPQPAEFARYAVSVQAADLGSTLQLYRQAIELRRRWFCADSDLEFLPAPHGVLAYRRGSGAVCIANMGTKPVRVDGEVLLASGPFSDGVLDPDVAVWLAPGETSVRSMG